MFIVFGGDPHLCLYRILMKYCCYSCDMKHPVTPFRISLSSIVFISVPVCNQNDLAPCIQCPWVHRHICEHICEVFYHKLWCHIFQRFNHQCPLLANIQYSLLILCLYQFWSLLSPVFAMIDHYRWLVSYSVPLLDTINITDHLWYFMVHSVSGSGCPHQVAFEEPMPPVSPKGHAAGYDCWFVYPIIDHAADLARVDVLVFII